MTANILAMLVLKGVLKRKASLVNMWSLPTRASDWGCPSTLRHERYLSRVLRYA